MNWFSRTIICCLLLCQISPVVAGKVPEEGVGEVINNHSELATNRLYAQTAGQKYQEQWNSLSLVTRAVLHLSDVIPFLHSSELHNAVNYAGAISILPGNNLKEQISSLWNSPDTATFKQRLGNVQGWFGRRPRWPRAT